MFSLTKLRDGIYHLEFADPQSLAAHFLRYQEYYESPQFAGKPFQLMDYVRWYASKKRDKKFSYFTDWSGFNIPANCVLELYPLVEDENDHDVLMHSIAKMVVKDSSNGKAYLIGTCPKGKKAQSVLNHEIAHGLFYVNPTYQKKMMNLVNTIPITLRERLRNSLMKHGYAEHVVDDELQAYLATGWHKKLAKIPKGTDTRFKQVFREFTTTRRPRKKNGR